MTKDSTQHNATRRRELGRSISKNSLAPKIATQHNTTHLSESTRRKLGRLELKTPKLSRSETTATASLGKLSCYSRQIRINIHLFETIQNAVHSAISGGNYRYGSAADFIREAIKDYAENKQLLVGVKEGVRKLMSLRLDEDLKRFWDSLPDRQRPNILERAIRTKLLNIN